MKTIKFLALMAVAAMLASCGTSKQTANSSTSSRPSSVSVGVDVDLPCIYESMDDDDYFRELGTSTNINMQNARAEALRAAKSLIKDKLGEFVQGLSTDYARSVRGNAPADKVQQLMERELTGVVEKMLNDAQKTCEKMQQDDAGNYHSFIAIQIPKNLMVTKMANTLSANEELEIEFNRDQFRKYAEDKMEKMQSTKKAAGY